MSAIWEQCEKLSDEPPTPTRTRKPRKMKQELAVTSPTIEEPSVALMLSSALGAIQQGEVTAQHVEVLGKMMDLYERNEKREAEKAFAKAFSELQAEMPPVAAMKPVPGKDGTIKYYYAPYEELHEQMKPLLSKHGFSVSFDTSREQGTITSICKLGHTSGHSQTNRFSVRIGSGPPHATEPQADTSAKNMAKRGAFSDALNIVVDHDDDARMIGKPIGKALAESLRDRVIATKSDELSFLKFAGVIPAHSSIQEAESKTQNWMEYYEQISDERYESLDELLRRKEGKLI